MKRSVAAAMFVVAALALTGCSSTETTPATDTTTAAATPVNSVCPLSGHEVPADAKTVVYKGQTIAFCCEACVEAWPQESEEARDEMLKGLMASR